MEAYSDRSASETERIRSVAETLSMAVGERVAQVPFATRYLVSESGVVWSLLHGEEMRPAKLAVQVSNTGHLSVGIRPDELGRRKRYAVHRLVAIVFIGDAPIDKPNVLHRDDDKTNNHWTNLYWGDALDNSVDALRNEQRVSKAPLRDSEGLTIRQRAIFEFIVSYRDSHGYPPSLREICAHMGIRSTNGANDHIRRLEQKGFIRTDPKVSRGIQVLARPTKAVD